MCDRFKELQPAEAEFILGFGDVLFSDDFQSQRSLVRYILEKFHRRFNSGDPINYTAMTIEHLLSQDTSAPEEVKASLGNLIFVSEGTNQKLKNKKFKDKKKIMVEEGLKLDPILLKADEWGQKQIKDRLNYMADLAYNKIWGL